MIFVHLFTFTALYFVYTSIRGNRIEENEEGNGTKTKEEEGNPVRWSLSLTGPGSAGGTRTVAPPLLLMDVDIHGAPFIYLF